MYRTCLVIGRIFLVYQHMLYLFEMRSILFVGMFARKGDMMIEAPQLDGFVPFVYIENGYNNDAIQLIKQTITRTLALIKRTTIVLTTPDPFSYHLPPSICLVA